MILFDFADMAVNLSIQHSVGVLTIHTKAEFPKIAQYNSLEP